MIGVKRQLVYEHVPTSNSCELVAVKVTCKHNSVIVASLYRPTNNDSDYTVQLIDAIESLVKRHPNEVIWIGGDANLPDINWSSNAVSGNNYKKEINDSFLQAVENCGLDQIVDFPTRDNNLLDIFLTNRPSLIQTCKSLPGISDHEIVYMDSDVSVKYQRPVRRKIWLWSKADVPSMKADMNAFSDGFTDKHSTKADIDTMWSQFSRKCTQIMTDYIPSKLSSARFSQPWINRDLKRLSRRKKRAYKKARTSNKKSDWNRYKQLKKESQMKCRRAYAAHVNDLVSDDQTGNPKKLYSFIKSKKCDASGVAPLQSNGINHSDSIKKSNILNDQFTSVFTVEDTTTIPKMNPANHPSVQPITVNRKGVLKLLNDINPYKATGPDAIPGRLLKSLSDEVADILTMIFQASLDQGKIPQDWKKAFISPIFKKGDRHKPSNYRPVSLTSICCKILEHIVHSHVIKHLDDHHLLNDAQHGFRKRRSCESQLILTVQDLAKGLNDGEQIDAVLLDFSKAFDKVPHQRLLEKLCHYGVRDSLNKWIADFLADRQQEVVLEGTHSNATNVTSGVPQGTVLGPLLFLVYINDMPEKISSTTRLFADDSLVYRIIRSKEDQTLLQQDLDKLQEWEHDWLMQFNADKCEVIRITNKRNPLAHDYDIHGTKLQTVKNAKYLGVTISSDLSWNTHVDTTAKKATTSLNFLKRNLHSCPSTVKDKCYKSLVRPIMEYASCVWDPHTQRNINKLEMVQRRAARFVKGDYSRTSSVTAMLADLEWNTLQQRRMQSKTVMLYRVIYQLVSIPVTPFLIPTRASRVNNMRYAVPRSTVNAHLYSFFPSAIRIWNQLPSSTVSAQSLETFKDQLPTSTMYM